MSTAKRLCPPEQAKEFRLCALGEEISELERRLSTNQRIGFCHNDLQYGNIMIDEETRSITLIVRPPLQTGFFFAPSNFVHSDCDVRAKVMNPGTMSLVCLLARLPLAKCFIYEHATAYLKHLHILYFTYITFWH